MRFQFCILHFAFCILNFAFPASSASSAFELLILYIARHQRLQQQSFSQSGVQINADTFRPRLVMQLAARCRAIPGLQPEIALAIQFSVSTKGPAPIHLPCWLNRTCNKSSVIIRWPTQARIWLEWGTHAPHPNRLVRQSRRTWRPRRSTASREHDRGTQHQESWLSKNIPNEVRDPYSTRTASVQ